MDGKSNNQFQKEDFLIKTSVRVRGYLLFVIAAFLIFVLITFLSSYLSWIGWILMVVFVLALFAGLTTLKTVELYKNGILIKYIINQKSKFYTLNEITGFAFYETRESYVKTKVLKLMIDGKEVVFTSLLYSKVNLINEELEALLKNREEKN